VRLLFVVSEDWYFVSHRLHLAVAAINEGHEVALLARMTNHREVIEQAGIKVFDWSINRQSHNPLKELRAFVEVVNTHRRYKPNISHSVAMKPVLYSAFSGMLTGVPSRVCAFGGLGFIFTDKNKQSGFLKSILLFVLRFALRGKRTRLILQNPDDQNILLQKKVIDKSKIRMIRGAGVDTTEYTPVKQIEGVPLVVLPARMLWDKGVGDFVECAKQLTKLGAKFRFALVGDPDPCNPNSVSEDQLKHWVSEGVLEWWGRCEDMPSVYKQTSIVCLPSTYGEGLPKALLEAASSSIPIVTYDVPGCREIVIDGKNGFLVPPKDIAALTNSINMLLNDGDMRKRFGNYGRDMVINEFSQERVVEETLDVWTEVLS